MGRSPARTRTRPISLRWTSFSEIDGGPRVVSVAYIALTHEDPVDERFVRWADWYRFLPWEDWRQGRPAILDEVNISNLLDWANQRTGTDRKSDG